MVVVVLPRLIFRKLQRTMYVVWFKKHFIFMTSNPSVYCYYYYYYYYGCYLCRGTCPVFISSSSTTAQMLFKSWGMSKWDTEKKIERNYRTIKKSEITEKFMWVRLFHQFVMRIKNLFPFSLLCKLRYEVLCEEPSESHLH